eukprot:gnl/MRDRNA2_/MRDRNA2_59485_c0_seq1.p1 gnl/MRDRNA2_/MRDRNA2_59485_c0~~gnl/MRDRNA2_/MRDRNA2_59485_c0_seq1.p1  ORF type:complete len:407 (+),score=62.04 gnl/MRDRNA2_/MRDRNA2_59485_c0_seq1:98-1318(+)
MPNVVKVPETPPVWDPDLMATIDKTIGPAFTVDPLAQKTSKLQGKQYKLTMDSKDSKIYPGTAPVKGAIKQLEKVEEDHEVHDTFGGVKLFKATALTAESSKPQAYKRPVEVFVPEGLDPSKPSPFMIFLDGVMWENLGSVTPFLRGLRKFCCCCRRALRSPGAEAISFTHAMNNLFKAKLLEPMVCIFLDPGLPDPVCVRGGQRNLEYDTVSNTFTDFVEQEVLPFVSEKCNVKLTTNPDQRAVMGMSSGGMAAITMGLTGRFTRILTSSPSCVNLGYPDNPEAPLQGWDYHSGKELIKNKDKVEGLRVVVVSNELDYMYQMDVKHSFNWTAASLRTAKALKEKGYACRLIFAKQGIHVDPRAWAQCFPEAVRWAWSDKDDNFEGDTQVVMVAPNKKQSSVQPTN